MNVEGTKSGSRVDSTEMEISVFVVRGASGPALASVQSSRDIQRRSARSEMSRTRNEDTVETVVRVPG